jgi:hypothetical protein
MLCMAEQTKLPMKREDTAARRWDPFDMFETLQEEMDRFWRRPGPSWTGSFPSLFRRTAGWGMTWVARMDVYEKDNNIVVKAELPEPKEPHTECVPVQRARVSQVLQRIAHDLEDLAAGRGAQREGRGLSRRERLADLEPKQPRLSRREERAQLRRQLGLDP